MRLFQIWGCSEFLHLSKIHGWFSAKNKRGRRNQQRQTRKGWGVWFYDARVNYLLKYKYIYKYNKFICKGDKYVRVNMLFICKSKKIHFFFSYIVETAFCVDRSLGIVLTSQCIFDLKDSSFALMTPHLWDLAPHVEVAQPVPDSAFALQLLSLFWGRRFVFCWGQQSSGL